MNATTEFKTRWCRLFNKYLTVRVLALLLGLVAASSKAQFSDANWVSLGSGIAGIVRSNVNALVVSGTNLYVGGYFTTAGGVPATNIAKWNGSTWSALGSGIGGNNASVSALAVSGTNLYAGGYFTTAGGVPASNIAKWDGSTWSALGSGMNSTVNALAVNGTNLYAGGAFWTAGGVPATNIAEWDGSSWSALGSGPNNIVFALAVSGTNLYAGGEFTSASGVPANHIAKWDGNAWSALGSGTLGNIPASFGDVYALAVSETNLYAGGDFLSAGGVTAYRIAKWDGSAWSALGSGMNGSVAALAVSETNLYAGGYFLWAGGVTAYRIAKWDGGTWSTLGSGVNSNVYALAVDEVGHLFVGGSFTRAGTNVSRCIAQANVATPPVILKPPLSQTGWDGATVYFSVNASGPPPLRYQWYFNDTNAIDNATNSILELTNLLFSQAGTYSVFVTNPYGSVTSVVATLTVVGQSPFITNQPPSWSTHFGDPVYFHVNAGGSLPLSYQWLKDTVSLNDGGNVSGAQTAMLGLSGVSGGDAGGYSVVVSNSYGSVTSVVATLTVEDPFITAQPTNQRIWPAGSADFSVSATGTPPLAYQWFLGTNTVLGATNAVLSLPNVQPWQVGAYTVVITNVYGAVTSAPAMLEVVYPVVTVTNCDETSLRAAMAYGGTVIFACDGTITLTGPMAKSITNQYDTVLDGTGHNVTISGGNAVRVLYNAANTSLTLINVTVANGQDVNGAGIFNDGGQLNLSQVVFRGNRACSQSGSAANNGGAILNSGGTVNATNCTFSGNQALGDTRSFPGYSPGHYASGGAIDNGGVLNLVNCTFITNAAVGGTGVGDYLNQDGPVGGNGEGGAVWNSGLMFVSGCTFNGNSAIGGKAGNGGTSSPGKAGPFPARSGGSGGSGSGGAIYNLGLLTLRESVAVSNSCAGGSGGNGGAGTSGYNGMGGAGGNGGGAGGGNGGALFNSGTAALVNDTFAFNTGMGAYGGNGGNGTASTASGYAGGKGGNGGNGGPGSGSISGSAYITNCTIAFNSSVGGLGGIGGTGGAGGPAGQPGATGYPGANGAAVGSLSTGVVVNTIVAGNAPSNGSSALTDAGHNISSDGTCFFTGSGSLNNADPKLGPLTDNGGPTRTMALSPSSPAIDAGDDAAAPPTDQRGYPRPFGAASDIGACEYTPPTWGALLQSQTAEAGSTVDFEVDAVGFPAPVCYYYFNETCLISCDTNCWWELPNCDFSQSGTYTVVISNSFGVVTSAPVMLNVIPPVERRPVPGVKVMGEIGSSLNVEHTESLGPAPEWLLLDTVSLTNPPQYWFDLTTPLPPQRFYRTQQLSDPPLLPVLDLHMVPAITLTGNIGNQMRLDCINQIGPTDAWVTLDTITLTNTSQLYFDTSSVGQPARLYRVTPVP